MADQAIIFFQFRSENVDFLSAEMNLAILLSLRASIRCFYSLNCHWMDIFVSCTITCKDVSAFYALSCYHTIGWLDKWAGVQVFLLKWLVVYTDIRQKPFLPQEEDESPPLQQWQLLEPQMRPPPAPQKDHCDPACLNIMLTYKHSRNRIKIDCINSAFTESFNWTNHGSGSFYSKSTLLWSLSPQF